MKSSVRYSVGVDIGGTFTDLVMIGDDASLHARKAPSTPDDYGRGIVAGLKALIDEVAVPAAAVDRVVHATTVATNAIVEGCGARAGLITTEGFRDVLEMRRLRIPEMYALNYPKPEPLVPRRLRLEVRERMGPRGEVRTALDEASVRAAAARLGEAEIEAVAICLLHAYANPDHERRVAEIVREVLPAGTFVTCSSDILPVIREYERTSTTVINAYLGPPLRRYFESLQRHLHGIGVTAPLQVMKSDGGIMTVAAATDKPAYIVESGPAAGVIGAASAIRSIEQQDCITLDMGGTTAKAAMVENGTVVKTGDHEVGAGINLSSKLVMGGGYALKLPVVDLSEIGAGGGSLVRIDSGGLLHVGPASAGAVPGPVAYDSGGEDPTFTDALVTLGYLNPDYLVGGEVPLNAAKARRALDVRVARPLGREVLECAHGVFLVACGTMVRAVKAVSTYRGRDPRDFALFAFGGNGPVVAAEIARMLEMRRVVVPPNPGVFSAFGLLACDVEQEVSRAFLRRLADTAPEELARRLAALDHDLAGLMGQEGYGAGAFETRHLAELRYSGQAHELAVAVPWAASGRPDLAALAAAFGAEHERTYGHQAEAEAVECVTLRALGRVAADQTGGYDPGADIARHATAGRPGRRRAAYFGAHPGMVETPVIARAELIAGSRKGPVIVEEYDSTCVVPPGWTAALDGRGNIRLEEG